MLPIVPKAGVCKFKRLPFEETSLEMPGKVALNPLPPGTKQPGLAQSLLYSGSRFQGHQKSKGNRYDVEVVLKVNFAWLFVSFPAGLHLAAFLSSEKFYALVQEFPFNYVAFFQHVEEEKGFLCGYLKIKGLTDVSTIK